MQYEKAWDVQRQEYVTAEQVDKCEMHDRNRYFSCKFSMDEDNGKVLTVRKEHKYKRKDKEHSVRTHFMAIADNTKDYREQTRKKQEHQESIVHKLCKKVINEIEFIHIPEIQTEIVGIKTPIIQDQYIRINKVIATEQKDDTTGFRPDATVEVSMLGINQPLLIEFCYKHPVSEEKRTRYRYYGVNVIEVDISELRDNLDEKEESLRKKIKTIIEERAYWISNRLEHAVKEAESELVEEISFKNLLQRSTNFNDCGRRYYIFKDGLPHDHRCYEFEPVYKSIDIEKCKDCKYCVNMQGYNSPYSDFQKVKYWCLKADDENILSLITKIESNAVEKLRNTVE